MPKHAAMPTNWARTIINNPMLVKLGSIFGPRDMPPLLIGTREMGKNLETSNTWLALLGCFGRTLTCWTSLSIYKFWKIVAANLNLFSEPITQKCFRGPTVFLLPLFAISICIESMLIINRIQNEASKWYFQNFMHCCLCPLKSEGRKCLTMTIDICLTDIITGECIMI